MNSSLTCPHCGNKNYISDDYIEKMFQCSYCSEILYSVRRKGTFEISCYNCDLELEIDGNLVGAKMQCDCGAEFTPVRLDANKPKLLTAPSPQPAGEMSMRPQGSGTPGPTMGSSGSGSSYQSKYSTKSKGGAKKKKVPIGQIYFFVFLVGAAAYLFYDNQKREDSHWDKIVGFYQTMATTIMPAAEGEPTTAEHNTDSPEATAEGEEIIAEQQTEAADPLATDEAETSAPDADPLVTTADEGTAASGDELMSPDAATEDEDSFATQEPEATDPFALDEAETFEQDADPFAITADEGTAASEDKPLTPDPAAEDEGSFTEQESETADPFAIDEAETSEPDADPFATTDDRRPAASGREVEAPAPATDRRPATSGLGTVDFAPEVDDEAAVSAQDTTAPSVPIEELQGSDNPFLSDEEGAQ